MEEESGGGAPAPKIDLPLTNPWEDSKGNPLPEESLKFVSRYWKKEIWEQYLSTIEAKQMEYLSSRFGSLLYKNDLECAHEKYLAIASGELSSAASEQISSQQLKDAINVLTLRERQTIEAIFFNSLSQTEAAKLMRLSTTRIHLLLRQALRKLKEELTPKT